MIKKFIFMCASVALLAACTKDDPTENDLNSGNIKERIPTVIVEEDKPIVAALRELAKENNIEDDFLGDNPQEWKGDGLKTIWEDNRLVGLSGGKGLVSLEISRDKNTALGELKLLKLDNANVLENLKLDSVSKLEVIDIDGKGNTTLKHIEYKKLPELKSLKLVNLLGLRTSTEREKEFKVDWYYDYPKLESVYLENLGVTDVYINPISRDKGIKLKSFYVGSIPLCTYINIENAKVDDLEFTKEKFPNLETIKINHIDKASAKEIKIEGLENLKYIYLGSSKNYNDRYEIGNLVLKNLPNLKTIDCLNTGLNNIDAIDAATLPNVKYIDLSGNNIAEADFTGFNSLVSIDLSSNLVVDVDNVKMPLNIKKVSFNGNENLVKVDLSKYSKLEMLYIIGHERNNYKSEKSSKLSDVKLPKVAEELAVVNLKKNSIVNIFGNGESYPKIETLDMERNNLTPMGLANCMLVAKEAVEEEYMEYDDSDSFNISFQKPFPVVLDKENKVDFTEAVRIMKECDDETEISFKLLDETPETDFETSPDKLWYKFLKPGKYKISMTYEEGALDRQFRNFNMVSQDIVVGS